MLVHSGILLRMTVAPGWLYNLSRANPFGYVVDAARAAFRGELTGAVVTGGLVSLALLAVTVVWGVRTFQRESA